MIRRLRAKFLALTLTAVLLLLLFLVTGMNTANFLSILDDADEILQILAEHRGQFPSIPPPMPPDDGMPLEEKDDDLLSRVPELAHETRYFSLLLGPDGSLLESDLSHIYSVDISTALSYAKRGIKNESDRGWISGFRYLRIAEGTSTRIIFLDFNSRFDALFSFLGTSLLIGLISFLLLTLLLVLLSGRIIHPLINNEKKQRRFVTDASHELKTPLTIINAHADLLEMEIGPNDALDEIRTQSQRLAQLTNELVLLARMDECKQNSIKIDFPLSDIVRDTVDRFRSVAETNGQSIQCTIAPLLTLFGDSRQIEQLVSILMENALKYTPKKGEIRVSLKQGRTSRILSIANTTHTALKERDLEHLFDRFYRPDSSRTSSTGGHGIGLSIAKEIVLAHGGRITATASHPHSFQVTAILPNRKQRSSF